MITLLYISLVYYTLPIIILADQVHLILILLLLHCVHGSGSPDHGHAYTLILLDLLTV